MRTENFVKRTYIVFAVQMAAWIGAWLLKISLEKISPWMQHNLGSFSYWTIAKIVLWIIPAFWLIRSSRRSIAEVLNLQNWKAWLGWGGGIGLLIGLTGIIPKYVQGRPILPTEFSFSLLNVLIIAPVFEEFLMRGAIQTNLHERYPFWLANIITSVLFVFLHIPGWYFMGVLWANLTRPIGGAFSIFLVSLLFGYAAHRSRSVMGGVVCHFLNNLFA
jgi:membrane protease YdiL (CAAX protease family)